MRRAPAALAVMLAACASAGPRPENAIQRPPESIAWTPGPPSLPAGTQTSVLEGDPAKDGMFTMRLKVPAGTRISPHWHPREERVTVLSGRVHVGFGDRFDEAVASGFGPGGFYVNPPDVAHFLWFSQDSIVQITGMGPWQLHLAGERAHR